MKTEVLRPFLEKVLSEWSERKMVEPDEDGDYVFRRGSADICVRLIEGSPPVLRLFSVLLSKVAASAKVFRVLNKVNSEILFVRVFWSEQRVLASLEVSADSLDAASVRHACETMARVADVLDTRLKEEIGGKLSHADEDDESEAIDV